MHVDVFLIGSIPTVSRDNENTLSHNEWERTMATKTRKPAREVTEAKNVPTRIDGKLNMVDLLLQMLDMPGSMSKAFNRFHKYSLQNMFLVYLQTGVLAPIATFKKWKSLGRTVISGPGSGLFVNHPKKFPATDKEGNVILNPKTKKPAEWKVVGFQLRPTVFQLQQTDGPELKMPELPEWDYQQALDALAIETIPFTNLDGNVGGFSKTVNGQHQLAINPANPGDSVLGTAVHEMAHIILGHTTPEFQRAGKYQGEHRGVAEFQAEATAYLVLHELEVPFNTADSRGYVQGWLKGRESDWLSWADDGNLELVQDRVVRAILKAADDIIVAGRKRHFDAVAAAEESERDSAKKVSA